MAPYTLFDIEVSDELVTKFCPECGSNRCLQHIDVYQIKRLYTHGTSDLNRLFAAMKPHTFACNEGSNETVKCIGTFYRNLTCLVYDWRLVI
jgi:hypothetical protein